MSLDRALPGLEVPPDVRRTLALAFAVDTVSAAVRARLPLEVVVATPDPKMGRCAADQGIRVLPVPDGSTETAVAESARAVAAREGLGGPTALLSAWLPALLPTEMDAALMSRDDRRCEYLDLGGVHCTFRADTNGWPAAASSPYPDEPIERVVRRLKKREFLPGLVCHVSTLDSLWIASYIGLGPATASVLQKTDALRRTLAATTRAFDDAC